MTRKEFIAGMVIISLIVISWFTFGNPVYNGGDIKVQIEEVQEEKVTTITDEDGNVTVYVRGE